MSGGRTVTFVADNPPYQAGESAAFHPARAQTLVTAGVARFTPTLADAAIDADPQAGKRTGQAARYARKG